MFARVENIQLKQKRGGALHCIMRGGPKRESRCCNAELTTETQEALDERAADRAGDSGRINNWILI